jgi:predicted small lipoprotein YifL
MSNLRALLVVACVGTLAACGSAESAQPDASHADIANIKNLRSDFPAPFTVTDITPTAIDPRVLEPQKLPAQIKFEPADCGQFANQQVLPAGVKGNMAALTAEGEGNRFIVIAVETSETVPVHGPPENCQKVGFAGPGMRGLIEVVDAPKIDGVATQGAHRVVQTTVGGKARTGELYNYVARFGSLMVIVTANPLVIPDKPVAAVDTKRAGELLSAGVSAVKA